jgi:FkbM family methyltransferase
MSAGDLVKKLLPLPIVARVAYLRQYALWGEWELRELSNLAPKPGLAIDVGANMGWYSYALKRIGLEVVSFEPDRTYQKRLRALLGRRARIETVALSNEQGTGVMRVPVVSGKYGGALGSLSNRAVPDGTLSTSYEVELRTLDSYGFENVSFVKIDVEGHEEAVLAGARNTLKRSKPMLLVEIEERHNPGGLERIAGSLASLGYSGSFFYGRRRRPLSEFVADRHHLVDNIGNDETNRRGLTYVNNFVFSPCEHLLLR